MSLAPVASTSTSLLNQLYANFCVYSATPTEYCPQESVMIFLQSQADPTDDLTDYNNMKTKIDDWLINGGTLGYTPITDGLRVQVILADGQTAYDSNSINNEYANIGIPSSTFITTGKYLINENQGTRSYNMGALLSQTGVFNQIKYSHTTGTMSIYLAVRQGISSTQPLGIVVISLQYIG